MHREKPEKSWIGHDRCSAVSRLVRRMGRSRGLARSHSKAKAAGQNKALRRFNKRLPAGKRDQTDRDRRVDTVQVIYNIFEQAPEDKLFPACEPHDIGVIVRVALRRRSIDRKDHAVFHL